MKNFVKAEGKYMKFARNRANKRVLDINLPETVVRLTYKPNNAQIFLIGTAHYSHESDHEVEAIIRKVQPDRVVVELCEQRRGILYLTERDLNRTMSTLEMRRLVSEKGLGAAIVDISILQAANEVSRKLGMLPGGEFRAANRECGNIEGCHFVLGDRKIQTTFMRLVASMSPWDKIRFAWDMFITSKEEISEEEIENMKSKNTLFQLMDEMKDEFPDAIEIILNERNVYLTGMIQASSRQMQKVPSDVDESGKIPPVIVAVVGIGHQAGIVQLFDQEVTSADFARLNSIPDPSFANRMASKSFTVIKYSLISLIIFKLIKRFCFSPKSESSGYKIGYKIGHFIRSIFSSNQTSLSTSEDKLVKLA